MSTWVDRISSQLTITNPLFAICLGLILILYIIVSVLKTNPRKLLLTMTLRRLNQKLDEAVESGQAVTLSLAHQGLGTAGIVHSVTALQMGRSAASRLDGTGFSAAALSGDVLVAAAAMNRLAGTREPPFHPTHVSFTGPEPFLTAANTNTVLQNVKNPRFHFGQASPETILLTSETKIEKKIWGGSPAALSGMLLSDNSTEALMGEDYYTAGQEPADGFRTLRLHNLIRSVLFIGFIAGVILTYLGIIK